MNTKLTTIKYFQVNDTFIFYGAIFQVTSECKEWTGHNGANDTTPCFGRECKFISLENGSSEADGLLKGYDWMQGVESVKYAKII